ncbi:MAG: hypothetical protein WAV98_01270 [Minisyncoccia bacterium]
MTTKKNVLFVGVIGSIILFLPAVINQIWHCSSGNLFICSDSYGIVASLAIVSTPLFLLSLITYRMKDEVFHAWWNFAKWFIPVIIVVTLWLENAGGGGGWGISSGIFEFAVLWLLYIIFIITSLVKIVRAYIKTRR